MGIFRTHDPTQYDDIDQIVIDETAPPSAIQGASSNVAILVGQFERGPATLTPIGSVGDLYATYGTALTSGMRALKSKKFGSLKIIRVIPAAGAAATHTFPDGSAVATISFTAKSAGTYGNAIRVTISAGSTTGRKYTITDLTPGTVATTEVYDNVPIIAAGATLASSALVSAAVLSTAAEPAVAAATALTGGTSPAVADTDYEAAISRAEIESAGNVLFLDEYNATRNGYLKVHAANTQDKMVIMAGAEADTVADSITAVATQRDVDGRIIYAYPWVQTTIDGQLAYVPPASFAASLISQTPPHLDPSYSANSQYFAGITGLRHNLTRQNYIDLKNAGIMAFEQDAEIGFKIKSGIVTQISDLSKVTVLRRRMADYLTNSAARFLKNYQGAVNSAVNRTAVKAALVAFVEQQEQLGMLPKDSEVPGGAAKMIDTESLNTATNIAQGYFYILWRQRIYSSMRYIVIKAEIGEGVVVTEG